MMCWFIKDYTKIYVLVDNVLILYRKFDIYIDVIKKGGLISEKYEKNRSTNDR